MTHPDQSDTPRTIDFWTAAHVAAVTGGKWSGRAPACPHTVRLTGVCTDDRAVAAGSCFVAVRGERHDGHDFARSAVEAGAAMVIASRPIPGLSAAPVLIVEDTVRALGRLAAAYRDHLGEQGAAFIAVCGSNGKTTTVRMIDAVLRAAHPGTSSQKSFNNAVGVPLTILSAKPGDHFVVCEVGTSAKGEIDMLGAIVKPDIAVITSIGREHLEGFGDVAGVMREEAAIARHLRPNGTLIYAEVEALPDGRTFEGLLGTFANPFTTRCLERAYWLRRVRPADPPAVGTRWKDLNGLDWEVPLAGEHNASNAMLAVWVGQAMGIDTDAIGAALRTVQGPPMRQQVTTTGSVTVVNDAYNANPDSMLAALASFAALTPGAQRRVAVLGQMAELGDASPAAHAEVLGAALEAPGVGAVIVVGPLFAAAAESAPPGALLAVEADLSDAAVTRLADYIKPGDAVLVKGSRSTRMERVAGAVGVRFAGKTAPARPAPTTVGPAGPRLERPAP